MKIFFRVTLLKGIRSRVKKSNEISLNYLVKHVTLERGIVPNKVMLQKTSQLIVSIKYLLSLFHFHQFIQQKTMETLFSVTNLSLSTIGLTVLVLLFSYIYWNSRRPKGLPPGPPILPLVGSIPFLKKDENGFLINSKLHKKYGDIYSIKLGRM